MIRVPSSSSIRSKASPNEMPTYEGGTLRYSITLSPSVPSSVAVPSLPRMNCCTSDIMCGLKYCWHTRRSRRLVGTVSPATKAVSRWRKPCIRLAASIWHSKALSSPSSTCSSLLSMDSLFLSFGTDRVCVGLLMSIMGPSISSALDAPDIPFWLPPFLFFFMLFVLSRLAASCWLDAAAPPRAVDPPTSSSPLSDLEARWSVSARRRVKPPCVSSHTRLTSSLCSVSACAWRVPCITAPSANWFPTASLARSAQKRTLLDWVTRAF
mmetsp:Transcript_1749/g.4463  ORF Transcript_1749/g.4463 Transcript_1749/m.4463 type:complete len:267 (-) Transcript_1749:514-1314(-)